MLATKMLAEKSVQLEFINPFIESTVEVFNMMLDCAVHRSRIKVKNSDPPPYQLSAVIEATGIANGKVLLSLSRDAACEVLRRMVGVKSAEINAEVRDAVGEITNIITGNAKAKLEHLCLTIAVPQMLAGRNHAIRFPKQALPITIEFESDIGPLALEIGFENAEMPAA